MMDPTLRIEQPALKGSWRVGHAPQAIAPDPNLHMAIRISESGGRKDARPLKSFKRHIKKMRAAGAIGDTGFEEFRPTFDASRDGDARIWYSSEEYRLKKSVESCFAHIATPAQKAQKQQRQEDDLRGMQPFPSHNGCLSRGRDGYNSPYDSVLAIEEEEGSQLSLPMHRFLTTPGPWTHLHIVNPPAYQ